MIVRTRSGSAYELDEVRRRVRRLSGTHSPTPRQGPDGAWKPYHHVGAGTILGPLGDVAVGFTMMICWMIADDDGEETMKCTETSVVVGID